MSPAAYYKSSKVNMKAKEVHSVYPDAQYKIWKPTLPVTVLTSVNSFPAPTVIMSSSSPV